MQRTTVVRRLKVVGIWIPAILLTLILVPQGWSKFSDTSGWAQAFRHWGYPDWFRITIGVLELTAAGLLVSGRAAAWGALLVVVIMLGAMGTHVAYDGGRHVTSEVVPLVLSLLVLWFRRASIWKPRVPADRSRRA